MTLAALMLMSATATAVAPASPADVAHIALDGPSGVIALSEVPSQARDAALRELQGFPEAAVTCTRRQDEDGRTIYEFAVTDTAGAEHIVDFAADGSPALLGAGDAVW